MTIDDYEYNECTVYIRIKICYKLLWSNCHHNIDSYVKIYFCYNFYWNIIIIYYLVYIVFCIIYIWLFINEAFNQNR